MPYICSDCLHVFERPLTLDDSFSHAFGVERRSVFACPTCGGTDILSAVPCANARDNLGWMRPGDHLCRACRHALAARLGAFFDTLTAEEQQQLDAWMDGASVTERGAWQ